MIHLAVFLGNPGKPYAFNRHNAGRLLAEQLPFYNELVWQKKFNGHVSCATLPSPANEPIPRHDQMIINLPQSTQRNAEENDEVLLETLCTYKLSADQRSSVVKEQIRYFLIPESYMNLSGIAARKAAVFYKLKPENIIVVHDELELPLGTLSLKFGGGLGGHNGLRSLKEQLGSADFWRIRVGIGRPPGRLPGQGGPPQKGIHNGGEGEIAAWVLSDFAPDEEPLLQRVLEAGAGLLIQTLTEEPENLLPLWKKKSVEQ